MRWPGVVLLVLSGPVLAQENRLWHVDLELEGPLESVELDCGAAGRTELAPGMVAGERRELVVGVPARVPLGAEALASQPLPRIRAVGDGRALVRGWSAEQPSAQVEALTSLRARARPPVSSRDDLPRPGVLVLALAAFVAALGLRRRVPAALALGAVGGLAAFLFGRADAAGAPGITLHEAELGAPLGLVVRGAREELRLPWGRLEVRPQGRALVFELELRDGVVDGRARASGVELFALEVEPAPALGPEENGFAELSAFWLRAPAGTWTGGGRWPPGTPLPDPVPGNEAPPGWLTAGLPPGRGVLVGRLSATGWIRVGGFLERD